MGWGLDEFREWAPLRCEEERHLQNHPPVLIPLLPLDPFPISSSQVSREVSEDVIRGRVSTPLPPPTVDSSSCFSSSVDPDVTFYLPRCKLPVVPR